MKKKVIILISIISIVVIGIIFCLIFNKKNNYNVNGFTCHIGHEEYKTSIGVIIDNETVQEYNKIIEELEELEDGYEKYFNLALNYRNLDDLDNACLYVLKSISFNEKYLAYSMLGTIYEEREDYLQSEKAFLRALSLNNQHINTYKKLGSLYYIKMRKYPDAMYKYYVDAIKITNYNLELTKHYASYLERINDIEYAINVWNGILGEEGESEVINNKILELEKKLEEQS
ncbi:hypothetical protein HOD19_04020 [bacterium]|jgi:tetratricopeptide (TPR) repeat protein|nr:hypothetical protein [bacterium]MBT4649498.1 hypothetical protein [bacterium]